MPDAEFKGVDVDGMNLEERLRIAIQEEESEIMSNVSNTSTNVKQSWADMLEDEELQRETDNNKNVIVS